jgi:hypothetical protein
VRPPLPWIERAMGLMRFSREIAEQSRSGLAQGGFPKVAPTTRKGAAGVSGNLEPLELAAPHWAGSTGFRLRGSAGGFGQKHNKHIDLSYILAKRVGFEPLVRTPDKKQCCCSETTGLRARLERYCVHPGA